MDLQSTHRMQASLFIASNGADVEEQVLTVVDLVCRKRNKTADLLFGRSRKGEVVEARFICFYLLSIHYGFNNSRIARAWGYDHTGVRHALIQFMNWLDTYSLLKKEVVGLMGELERDGSATLTMTGEGKV